MKVHIFIVMIGALLLCGACHTVKETPFLADATYDSAYTIVQRYTASIHPGDRLYISVNSTEPEGTIAFNQETARLVEATKGRRRNVTVEGYLVDAQGCIDFPQLGRLSVAGISRDSLVELLQQKLETGGYVKTPVVTCRLMNFRVAVVGEVVSPVNITVQGERYTLLEALAAAGDVSLYGRRDNIRVVREVGNDVQLGVVDLTKVESLNSPYYYLQPNDIVYVEPNKRRKHEAYSEEYLEDVQQVARIIRTATQAAEKLTHAMQVRAEEENNSNQTSTTE